MQRIHGARNQLRQPYKIEIFRHWEDAEAVCLALERGGIATPFQTTLWLRNWFQTIGKATTAEPLLILVHDTTPLFLLPLILHLENGLRVIGPADLGATDLNAPLMRAGTEIDAGAVWKAIKATLPAADLIRITKIPAIVQGKPNWLAQVRQADRSPINGNLLTLKGNFVDYHKSLDSSYRREIDRSWRVFGKHEAARFEFVEDVERIQKGLATLERQQAARMAELGQDYILDRPDMAAFFQALVMEGTSDGTIRMSMLLSGDVAVAILLGITRGETYTLLRMSTAGAEWRNCSPGRLLIHKTIEALGAEGFRHFDYTIGDYDYKRRMGAKTVALYNILEGRSLRGTMYAAKERLRFRLQLSPTWRKLKGRKE